MLACVLAGADEARVLRVGLEEVVHAVLAERVEVVVRLRRFERRLDGGETGVRRFSFICTSAFLIIY